MVVRGPTLTPAPIRTWPIFMTRSSNRWVCGPDQACSTASPMATQSYSVTSVVSMNRLVTASLFQTKGVHIGSARGRCADQRPFEQHQEQEGADAVQHAGQHQLVEAATKPCLTAIGITFITVR